MKKILSLVLVLMMVLSCCSFSMAEETTKEINVRWRYHSLMNNISEADGSYYDNRITQAHEAQSGIKVNWEYQLQNGTEETQKQTLMLASGNELPDLMKITFTNYQSWAPQGLFVETTDAIATMTDYKALVDQLYLDYAAIDGSIYCFPSALEEGEMWGGSGIVVRYDIYETLGLEKEPQTAEEYYQMWKKVQEMYPEMTPLAGSGVDPMKAAFGVYNTTEVTEDGNLIYTFTTPEYKEYVEYMHKLYAEGILNQEYGTDSTSTLEEQFVSGKAFSTATGWATPATSLYKVFDNIEGSKLEYLPQMTKDAETPAVLQQRVLSDFHAVVPVKKSDKFDIVCEWINYHGTKEAKNVQDYGIEGIDYTVDAEGKVVQTLDEQNAVGWKICYEIIATAPSFYVRLYAKGFDWAFNDVLAGREESNVVGEVEMTNILPLNEEFVELRQELGVTDYVSEQTTLFIIGQRDMSEWDAFQAELEDRGLAELSEALNEWYKMYN